MLRSVADRRTVTSYLLRLLAVDTDAAICACAAATLAELVRDDEPRQRAACDLDAMRRLRVIVDAATVQGHERTRLRRSGLSAVAALIATCDECRQCALDAGLAHIVVAALEDTDVGVRVAAARCTRAFSRSPRLIRRALHDVAAGPVLARLLYDEIEPDVLAEVLPTVANLVVEYSPVKDVRRSWRAPLTSQCFLQPTAIARISALTGSPDARLRVPAMAALKNACHWSATALKERVAGELTWARIASLARDPADPALQEETVGLIRNLACTTEGDIAMVIGCVGESALFEIVGGALWSTRKGTMLNVRDGVKT